MPSPPLNPNIEYTSACEGCCCDCCAGSCCSGCEDSCDCGTDCSSGTVCQDESQLDTPHGDFSYSFDNLFSLDGAPVNPNFGMGTNFLPSNWAYATTSATNEWGFIWGPKRAHWFEGTSPYTAKYGSKYILTVLPSGDYRLNDPETGTVYVFDAATGLLASTTTAGGQATVNTIVGSQITETARSFTYTQCGQTLTTTEVRSYAYYPAGSGASTGLLQYVTLQRPDDSAAAIRRIALTYYQAGDSGGNAGDLQTVSVQLLRGTTWQTLSTTYYRYYTQDYDGTANTQPGYAHGLKFVVKPEAFARLSKVASPFTAPDNIISRYADFYYEYTQLEDGENIRRVTKSVTGAGTHVHTFSYENAPESQPLGYNYWYLETTANRADGSQKITFSNYVKQPIPTDLWDTPGDQSNGRWINYTTYDATCDCVSACYSPASINMSGSPIYDPSAPDLAVSVLPIQGLVKVFTYTDDCYLDSEQVQQGASGSPITIRQYSYTSQTVGTSPTQTTVVLPATVTNYQSDASGGSDPTTTSYAYTYYTATVQVQTKTTTLPQIPTSQNGQGDNPASDPLYVIVETYDIQGRLSARTDPYDSNNVPAFIPSITYAYDEPTGALIQEVTNPYSGTPPSDSEYNLITDYQVDELGRTVQTLGPAFNANGQLVRTAGWTVYDDLRREVLSAAGFATGSNNGPQYAFTLVNPVSITKMDYAGRTTDQIRAVRESTDGPLAASDRFPQTSWVRWTRYTYEDPGDLIALRVYHKIPKDCAGFPGENYDETTYGYDVMDRANKVRSPGGTITRTVFDVRNQAVQVYVGTDDVGATDEAPDGFNVPGNNMVKVQTNIYDNGDPVGGNGLLTTAIQHIDGTMANDRRTDYGYDFRNRQTTLTAYIVPTGTISLVETLNTYDNLNRIVQVDQYDSTTLAAANRIRESQTLYDNLGRVFQALVYAVPITGGSAGTPSTPQISNT